MEVPQDVQDCIELIRQWREGREDDRLPPPPPVRRRRRRPIRGPRTLTRRRRQRTDCNELLRALRIENTRRNVIQGRVQILQADREQRLAQMEAQIEEERQREFNVNNRIAELQAQYDRDCLQSSFNRRRPGTISGLRLVGLDTNDDGNIDTQAIVRLPQELDRRYFESTDPRSSSNLR